MGSEDLQETRRVSIPTPCWLHQKGLWVRPAQRGQIELEPNCRSKPDVCLLSEREVCSLTEDSMGPYECTTKIRTHPDAQWPPMGPDETQRDPTLTCDMECRSRSTSPPLACAPRGEITACGQALTPTCDKLANRLPPLSADWNPPPGTEHDGVSNPCRPPSAAQRRRLVPNT